jgi:hypothetical protein
MKELILEVKKVETDGYPDSGVPVFLTYNNRVIKGMWIKSFTEEVGVGDDADEDNADYDEEHDCWFYKEGWYELVDNWDEFYFIPATPGKVVTHWMSIPKGFE